MKRILFVRLLLGLLIFTLDVSAEELVQNNRIEVVPANYGKYGITPFVGPVEADGTQETTLVFNKIMQNREVEQVKLLFFSSKKILILANENHFECKHEKCFVIFGITPDYQNNIEFELIYSQKTSEIKPKLMPIVYRIKEIGALTGRLNRRHKP